MQIDRRLFTHFDWTLLGIVLLIASIGILNLYSAAAKIETVGAPLYLKQIFWLVIGLAAMVTIAFGQVFYYIAFQWSSLTGGDDGLRGFARQPLDFELLQIDLLHNEVSFYYFVLVCFAAVVTIMAFILRSPFGRTMIAIRENERRARFLGIPIELHIWIAFTLSCFFMAFAGALYALINNFADPRMLHYTLSGDFVIMAVMGGMRAFWGPLLGAVIFVVLQDYISSVTVNWMSFIGILIVFIVLFFPRGVLGLLRQRRAA